MPEQEPLIPEVIIPPRPAALLEGTTALVARARALARIVTQDDADQAGLFLRAVRERIRNIKAYYKKQRASLDLAYDDMKRNEDADLGDLLKADGAVGAAVSAWLAEEKARAEAENRRRLAEAQRAAEEERARQAQQLRDAAQAAQSRTERQALESQAKRVEKSPALPVAVEAVAPPKIDGISTPDLGREAVVVNEDLLLNAVLRGKVPRAAVTFNQKFLNEQATKLGKDLNYPGVIVRDKKPGLTARGGA